MHETEKLDSFAIVFAFQGSLVSDVVGSKLGHRPTARALNLQLLNLWYDIPGKAHQVNQDQLRRCGCAGPSFRSESHTANENGAKAARSQMDLYEQHRTVQSRIAEAARSVADRRQG
jgi:hypothetical protein